MGAIPEQPEEATIKTVLQAAAGAMEAYEDLQTVHPSALVLRQAVAEAQQSCTLRALRVVACFIANTLNEGSSNTSVYRALPLESLKRLRDTKGAAEGCSLMSLAVAMVAANNPEVRASRGLGWTFVITTTAIVTAAAYCCSVFSMLTRC
jgi:hypothetical protein